MDTARPVASSMAEKSWRVPPALLGVGRDGHLLARVEPDQARGDQVAELLRQVRFFEVHGRSP